MSLKDVILSIVKDEVSPTINVGKVKSFNAENFTCDIDLITAPDVFDVRIKAVINEVQKGICIEPKVGSTVLIASINNKIESSVILSYSEIERIHFIANEAIELNGDGNGGLVISSKVASEITELKNEVNALKTILSSWVTVPQDGGAALKALLSTWASQLQVQQASFYENQKVKHGE